MQSKSVSPDRTKRKSPPATGRAVKGKSKPELVDLSHIDKQPDVANVDIRVVAAIYGRSITSIWRDDKAGRIPPSFKCGTSTRWNLGAIRRHIANLSSGK